MFNLILSNLKLTVIGLLVAIIIILSIMVNVKTNTIKSNKIDEVSKDITKDYDETVKWVEDFNQSFIGTYKF